MKARTFERLRHWREEYTVSRHREVLDPRLRREPLDQHRQVLAQQWFSARQPQAPHADVEEHVNYSVDLFEMEDVVFGQPHVVLLRHAVLTPEITAIRDR